MAEELRQRVGRLKEMLSQLEEKDREISRLGEEHRQFNTMIRALCDSLPIMIWAKDLNERYLFANKACCEIILNATSDEVIGKNDLFFAEREKKGHSGNNKWHTFGTACHESDQWVITHKERLHKIESGYAKGEVLTLDVVKVPFLINGGDFIGIVGFAKDVTGKKRRREDKAHG